MAFYNSPFNATIVNKRYFLINGEQDSFHRAIIKNPSLRIEGEGTFAFENKSIYRGSFKDGQ